MTQTLVCPSCKYAGLDVRHYESMMVLRSNLAFFTITCPKCGSAVSSLQAIPASLREEVNFAAIEIGAGMGQDAQC